MFSGPAASQTSISAVLSSLNAEAHKCSCSMDTCSIQLKIGLVKEAESCLRIQMKPKWTCSLDAFLSLSHCCYCWVDPQTAGQQTLADVHILSHYHIKGENKNISLWSPSTLLCARQNRDGEEKKINRWLLWSMNKKGKGKLKMRRIM